MNSASWVLACLALAMGGWAWMLRKHHRDRRRAETETLHFEEWEREIAGSEEGRWP